MTFAELRAAVYARTGVDALDGLLTPAVVGGFVNDALGAYQVEHNWPWLIAAREDTGRGSTAVGAYRFPTAGFSYNTGTSFIDSARVLSVAWKSAAGYVPLRAWGVLDFAEAYDISGTAPLAPAGYTIDQGTLVAGPVTVGADYTFQVRYVRGETPLALDSDTPSLPPRFHPMLVEYAAALTLDRARDFDRADRCRKEFDAWLARVKLDADANTSTGPAGPAPTALTTFRAIREAVIRRSGVDVKAGVWTPDVVGGYVNDALHAIEIDRDWPWQTAATTIALTAGVDTYPTDAAAYASTLSVRLTVGADDNGRHLTALSPVELDERYSTARRGRPDAYAEDVGALVFRPIPDGAYTAVHRYVRAEATLVADTDQPLMPLRFRTALVDLAAAYLADAAGISIQVAGSRRPIPHSTALLAAYNTWRDRMVDDRTRTRRPKRIRTRQW